MRRWTVRDPEIVQRAVNEKISIQMPFQRQGGHSIDGVRITGWRRTFHAAGREILGISTYSV